VIGALIDTACGFAAATLAGRVLASHYAVNCLRPAVGERFVARARVVKPTSCAEVQPRARNSRLVFGPHVRKCGSGRSW
jgi:acyl-coenzyme A thioesterase PaaI-like protein